MPLGNRTRLQRTVQPPLEEQSADQTIGKRSGQFIHGMANFYGNIMKGAVNKIKEGRKSSSQQAQSSDGSIDFG